MSMLLTLRQVGTQQLDLLIQDPSDVYFFITGEEKSKPEPVGFFARIFGKSSEAKPARPWQQPAEHTLLDLDKNWHILHFAFCQAPWEAALPQATLLCGGVELGTTDLGYGPARALTTKDLAPFLQFLNGLSLQTFSSEVTSESIKKNEIYFSADEWDAEAKENLWACVVELRQFIQGAITQSNGVIIYLY